MKHGVYSKQYSLAKRADKIGYYLVFMTYIGCTSSKSMVSTWIVSYLLVYTWHTPLHYPHAANAGCVLAGVAPVQCTIRIRRTHTESCLQLQRDYLLIRISIEPPLNVVLCWHTCQCMKKCTNNISYVCESLPLPSSSTLLHRKIVDQKTKCSRKSVIRCHWNCQCIMVFL